MIDNKFPISGAKRVLELPSEPMDTTVVGMILGVSRKISLRGETTVPYILHVTDFSAPNFEPTAYFEDRDFHRNELQFKTYDLVIFPNIFEQICDDLKNEVDLKKRVRYFKFDMGRPYYVDDWIEKEDARDALRKAGVDEFYLDIIDKTKEYFLVENFHLWITCKVKGKTFRNNTELRVLNRYSMIPIGKLHKRLKSCGQDIIWKEFERVYGSTSVFNDIFSDSDDSACEDLESRSTKRIKYMPSERYQDRFKNFEGDNSQQTNNDNNQSREMNNNHDIGKEKIQSHLARKFKNISYTLLSELPKDCVYEPKGIKYEPFFIIVHKIDILENEWEGKDFVFEYNEKLLLRRVKFNVFDEFNNRLILTVPEGKICDFLGLSVNELKSYQFLNAEIIEACYAISVKTDEYRGMVISRKKICDGVYKWCWEYSTNILN